MNIPKVAVIMRSKDEQPYVREALENLMVQTYTNYNLYNVDSGSSDGTLEVVKVFSESVKSITSGSYVPGTVLNDMISSCHEKIVVFLNLQVGMSIRVEGKAIKKSTKLEFIHPEVEIIQKNKSISKF